jgi:glycosyltransferase involved in cell wall biosynthesis
MADEISKMKKIAILYEGLSEIGGLERVMVTNYNWLKDKFKVYLGFAHINKEIAKNELYNKLKIKKISELLIKNESLEIIWFCTNPFIKRIKVDLAISHSFLMSYYCYRKKIPYIIFMHHPPNFLYPKITREWINHPKRFFAWLGGKLMEKWLKNLDKKCVKNAKLIFANSGYTKKRINQIYKIDATVIYPPKNESFRILNIKKKNFIYAHGRVIPDKKFEYVIEAMKHIPNKKLVISGSIEKNYEKKLKNLIKKLRLQNRIKILGRISEKNLIKLYNEAKVFVLTAPHEDFGIVPVEAISCGTPVIAWNDGAGPTETIIENVNGFLAKPYDIKDLTDKIKKAMNKKWDRNKIIKTTDKFLDKIQSKIFLKDVSKVIKNHNL